MRNNLSTIMGTRLLGVGEVAMGAKLSRSAVSNIRNKHNENIKISTLIKLCDYLQIPLHELIDYDPRERQQASR